MCPYTFMHIYAYICIYLVIFKVFKSFVTDYTKYITEYAVKAVFSFVINLFTGNLQLI